MAKNEKEFVPTGKNKGNGRSNRKGGWNKSKNRRPAVEETAISEDTKSGYTKLDHNDPAWYLKNPELMASAANLPFPYVPGTNVEISSPYYNNTLLGTQSFALPGVLAVRFHFSCGWSSDVQSPASISAKELWARIRSLYSGRLDADPTDVFMYTLAVDEIFAMLSHAKRLYRIAHSYNAQNRYMPERLWEACGMSTSNLIEVQTDLPRYWGRINELIHKASKFSVPKNMPIFDRHRFMCDSVYADSDSPRAQLYVFVPRGMHRVDDTNTTHTGTYLTYSAFNSYNATFDDILNRVNMALEALNTWEDAYSIHGYFLKAFSESEWYTIPLLDQAETISVTYDPKVLFQVANAHALGMNVDTTSMDIYQDPLKHIVYHQPKADINSHDDSALGKDVLLCVKPNINLPAGATDGTSVILATRMGSYVSQDLNEVSQHSIRIHSCSEIYEQFYWLCGVTQHVERVTTGSEVVLGETLGKPYEISQLETVAMISNFTAAPRLWMYIMDNDQANLLAVRPLGAIDNFTTLTLDQFDLINEYAMYSLFDCFNQG